MKEQFNQSRERLKQKHPTILDWQLKSALIPYVREKAKNYPESKENLALENSSEPETKNSNKLENKEGKNIEGQLEQDFVTMSSSLKVTFKLR